MPNIKSAEKRVRSSAGKPGFNRAVKSRVATLEKQFKRLVKSNQKDEAQPLLSKVISAYDKAAKTGVCHRNKADHKKSRLTQTFNTLG